MTRRSRAGTHRRIQDRVVAGAVDFTYHAVQELIDDELSKDDAKNAILFGRLVDRLRGDVRGYRFLIRGPAFDGEEVEVVCRLLDDKVRIVTVYRL